MTVQPLLALTSGDPSAWDQALYAFLVEKGNRSGSRRTVESYGRMLWPFFADLGKTPDRVKPADVLAWVHGIGKSGRTPSATTVGARIACLSSFYRFLIRMGLVLSNPTEMIERPRSIPSPARGYSADEVRRLLAVVPDTVAGRRDRAILLTLVLTGRRRAEAIGLKAGDLSLEGETVFYAYRGKGNRRGRRELPCPAFKAIQASLADAGKELATMALAESLWQAGARPEGVTSGTFYSRFRHYLRAAGLTPTGIHVLRHTVAKLRRDAGESIEEVSAFLDHSSLAVTTVYLRRLEGQEDRAWRAVAEAIGV
ncbi:MAG: tyrosine-type recombinase/integrase [Candidatus Limnocylindrales bacterium]|jgi:integrase/recombinase XerC